MRDDHRSADPPAESLPPRWWEGRWPAGGINSLEGLENWIDDRLNEMIALDWSGSPSLKEMALPLGRQTIRNATRFLRRHGGGNPPSHPPLDTLTCVDDVEAALEAIRQYIRQCRTIADSASPSGAAAEGKSNATFQILESGELDPASLDPKALVLHNGIFALYYGGKECTLKSSKGYRVLLRLTQAKGQFVSISTIVAAAWGAEAASDETVQKQVSLLRTRLEEAGMEGIEIEAQQGHYRLKLS